jgi:hypothetical protein
LFILYLCSTADKMDMPNSTYETCVCVWRVPVYSM